MRNFVMRFKSLIFLLVLVLSSYGVSAETISGFISVERGRSFFVNSKDSKRYLIVSRSDDAIDHLKKLNPGDFFNGTGSFQGGSLYLESIDFVGLRKLLGLWVSDESWLNFRNYSDVSVYSPVNDTQATKISDLSYSVAPDSAKTNWRIFFSSKTSVVLGSLSLVDNKAILQFYDVDSGAITKTVELKKLTSYQ